MNKFNRNFFAIYISIFFLGVFSSIYLTRSTYLYRFFPNERRPLEHSVINVSGAPKDLFVWKNSACNKNFTADTPTRAFRDEKEQVNVYSTHYDNWRMVGSSLLTVNQDCLSTMPQNIYRQKYAGSFWIESTYTLDGTHVTALISEDLTQVVKSYGCHQNGNGNNCWLNYIRLAYSTDSGKTFNPSPQVIAGDGVVYDANRMGRQGFFTTSNIVFLCGYYYVIIYQKGIEGTKAGNCILRTNDIINNENWFYWNGRSFADKLDYKRKPICIVIGDDKLLSEVRSLSYVPSKKLWVAIFSSTYRGADQLLQHNAIYSSMSLDLLIWSDPRLVMDTPRDLVGKYIIMYPSLLDDSSKSRNYDTLDSDNLYLFYIKLYRGVSGEKALNRDISYVPVNID